MLEVSSGSCPNDEMMNIKSAFSVGGRSYHGAGVFTCSVPPEHHSRGEPLRPITRMLLIYTQLGIPHPVRL